jgi:hypothetical protein
MYTKLMHIGLTMTSVRPSARMIQFLNRCTAFDEIWYRRYAIGSYPKIVLISYKR